MSQREAAEKEIKQLLDDSQPLQASLKDKGSSFIQNYQRWYTRAVRVIEITLPDRIAEFRGYYESDPKRKFIVQETYVIQDFFKNLALQSSPARAIRQMSVCFGIQVAILQSVADRLDSVIGNIEQTFIADIRDAELQTAQELLTVSVRAAGALAAVILESHLKATAAAHNLTFRKKKPTYSDYNDSLKKAKIIGQPEWRKLSWFGDIRNLCCHKKDEDPTAEQVRELIEGANWALRNVY